MSDRYPAAVRTLNQILRSELGENPRYAWRWSEDLIHVMELIHDDGRPIYVEAKSPAGLTIMVPKTATRKLLPLHENCWVMCALIGGIGKRDGSITGTGDAAWVPLSSSASGPCVLPQNEVPNHLFTDKVITLVRQERSMSPVEFGIEYEKEQQRKEKDRWNRVYDEIRDASTAFCNVPGAKGHVSFPSAATNTQRIK